MTLTEKVAILTTEVVDLKEVLTTSLGDQIADFVKTYNDQMPDDFGGGPAFVAGYDTAAKEISEAIRKTFGSKS